MRSNGFPSGHTDLHSRHPGLGEDLLEGVLVAKVPSTSFGLEVVKNEATEDVEWLFEVGETTGVVGKESRGIIFPLPDSFAEERERPGEGEASGSFPFLPDPLVGFPHMLGHGAFQQAVLGGFFDSRVANFAMRRDSHDLEPGADRSPLLRVNQMRVPTFLGRALCQFSRSPERPWSSGG